MGTERKRIDVYLTDAGLFPSRSAARAAVMAGLVTVDGQRVDKPGTAVSVDAAVDVRELPRYVSRGGLKLEKALRGFQVDVKGRVVMDVGASTGGFTDCLLQHGAAKVYSVDVGYGQLDWKLRQDSRVVSMERTNIRKLQQQDLPEEPDFASVDVSFISLTLVLPVLKNLGIREIVTLVKPQFEVGKGRVGKKGVVRDAKDHQEVLEKVAQAAEQLGYAVLNAAWSPIRGPEGNIEYLLHLHCQGAGNEIDFASLVAQAQQSFTEKGDAAGADE
ncbi:TlyA family RNA methyltransferase [Dethiobacter alkaliphilus]|uniref:TlyA family RNA methyltransferase n=1 Tax=Dethiobacter alkaliphilus TaxID=427926 RepID=UPI002226CE2B|nr:TlyA family RNA methyltransferase [Dethiobacter alkaliphilus]MCW3490258.1 TlyA family RNA methyltransferase [Dethiobacter alkaliphilus]